MAKLFDTVDAERLIQEHRMMLEELDEIAQYEDNVQIDIEKAANLVVTRNVLDVLRDIPVEEINREKGGFRVEALRDHGFRSIADIVAANVYSISSVHGISEDAAYSIKRIANNMADKVREGAKIKLSVDNKTRESTALVTALSKYVYARETTKECRGLITENRRQIEYAIEDLLLSQKRLKWIFASSAKKQKAVDAYKFLDSYRNGNYGQRVREQRTIFENTKRINGIDAWKEFSEHSVSFFNALENIVPGTLGNDDSIYGLPEELAREVQEECFFPDGLLCELRRYQEWGVKYALHQKRVLLGDEMGLGKTVQAIATMVSLKNTGASHFAVVCPASVVTNWCREIRKMSRLQVVKIHGAGRKEALNSWISAGGVAVTTFETTAHFNLPESFELSLLVVDEAHYIKNSEARRTMNVKKICERAERMLFMTGTALENKPEEMVALIHILRPDIALRIQHMLALTAAPQFREAVAPVYYRRKREDVLTELPELIESEEWCTLGQAEKDIYEQAVFGKNFAETRRVSWNAENIKDSCKAKRLMELIEEAESEKRKVIIFSFFLDTIRKVVQLLGGRCMNPINGSVSPQRRQEIIDDFDKAPAGAVLAAQIQSGGTGLNIQSASVIILCEPQLKPSIENQAISRAYRMGQTRNVLVYRLLCENSIDERIMDILKDKQEKFDAFADKSVAAAESIKMDDHTIGNIIAEEIERIKAEKDQSNEK